MCARSAFVGIRSGLEFVMETEITGMTITNIAQTQALLAMLCPLWAAFLGGFSGDTGVVCAPVVVSLWLGGPCLCPRACVPRGLTTFYPHPWARRSQVPRPPPPSRTCSASFLGVTAPPVLCPCLVQPHFFHKAGQSLRVGRTLKRKHLSRHSGKQVTLTSASLQPTHG